MSHSALHGTIQLFRHGQDLSASYSRHFDEQWRNLLLVQSKYQFPAISG